MKLLMRGCSFRVVAQLVSCAKVFVKEISVHFLVGGWRGSIFYCLNLKLEVFEVSTDATVARIACLDCINF